MPLFFSYLFFYYGAYNEITPGAVKSKVDTHKHATLPEAPGEDLSALDYDYL
jgi:hypothetical protein